MPYKLLCFFIGFLLCITDRVHSLTQEDIDNMASNLDIRYEVVDNFIDTWLLYQARVTLTNKGTSAITKGDWAVYFCSIRIVEPDHLRFNPNGYVVPGGSGIKLTHINGCLHKMEPTDDFKDLSAGDKLKIEFKVKYFSVARTDVMPNWYVAGPGLNSKPITSTVGEDLEFVGNFITKRQWKRQKDDRYHPYSPQQRYDAIEISDLGKASLLVIPTPVSITGLDQNARTAINATGWQVFGDVGLENETSFLAGKLKIPIATSAPPQLTKMIRLTLGDPDVTINGKKSTNQEAYSLEVGVSSQIVNVTGRGAAGVFYGIQTLLALTDGKNTVPMVTIKDAPRYGYRGMHLDVGRNFKRKETVLKLLDMMATYKLNKFHFHLSEDEGWRLEITGLEELTSGIFPGSAVSGCAVNGSGLQGEFSGEITKVGSKRCHDLEERTCLIPQLGSDPKGSGTTDYYTRDDYRDILSHAEKLHIQVIPEFDMPGHGHAAIKSMEARYHRLKAAGNGAEAEKYLLTELNDTSQYMTVQWFTDDAINPCLESTYTFVDHVVKALVSMHSDIQPLTMYHFGGDEVAHGAWTNSNACRNFAQRLGLSFSRSDMVDILKEYFVQRVANITVDQGLDLGGWEDGLLGPNYVPYKRQSIRNNQVYAYAWRGGGRRTNNLANAGYKVVLSQATHLYFDHPYEPDPEERGYYWAARFTDTRKTFGFLPENLYANVEVTRWGDPITREQLCKLPNSCPELNKKENIVGMAGALWTETVRTADQMDSMVFPRLLALAERMWHKASWEGISDKDERNKERTKDWEKFGNFLGHHELARLDRIGIKYHVPPPGARADGSKIKTKTMLPGLSVQYSDDGGKTWHDVTDETRLNGKVKIATRSADRARLSRLVDFQGQVTNGATSQSLNGGLLFSCLICILCKI